MKQYHITVAKDKNTLTIELIQDNDAPRCCLMKRSEVKTNLSHFANMSVTYVNCFPADFN